MPKRLSLLLYCAFLMSACASVRPPELKPKTPELWRNASANTGNTESTTAWWKLLNDSNLNEIVTLAQQQNLTIAQASERLIAARSINQTILANQKPQVGFTAGPDNLARAIDTTTGSTANFRTRGAFLAGFDLNWEMPFFGRGESQRNIGRADVNAATAGLQSSKVSITAEVVRIYGNLKANQYKVALLSQQVMHYQTLDTIFSQALSAGLLSKSEFEANRASLIEAKQALINTNTQRELALLRLAVLCGQPAPLNTWTSESDAAWKLNHEYTLAPTIPADLIRQRPDIAIAEANVLNAAGQAGVAHADIYPKFNIQGALQVAGSLSNARPTRVISVIAPSVSIPIIDWGLARQVANVRDAKLREAILAYQEAVLLAIEETESAFTQFNAAQQKLSIQQEETDRLTHESAGAEAAMSAGYIGRVALIKTQVKSNEHLLQETDTQLEWLTAFALTQKAQARMRDDFYLSQVSQKNK